jgi:hypothetical protein
MRLKGLGQPQSVRRQADAAGRGHLFHAGGEVRGLADRRVIHVQVAADGPHDDLAGVEADANLHLDAVRAPGLLGVPLHRFLHAERRIAGPHRVILVGERSAEERHDAVAHHLVDRALVAVDGLHHVLDDGVE